MIAIDLCTFDPGVAAKSPAAFAGVVVDCVESSWDNGADLVLLPEFTWVGLEPLVEPEPGDLVFFNTMRHAFSHVGIYVGDGKFIHSPRTGSEIRVEDMRESYWQRRFDGARRVPMPTASAPSDLNPR